MVANMAKNKTFENEMLGRFHLRRSRSTFTFQLLTMRHELCHYCVAGAEVAALDTLFDDSGAHGWLKATDGVHWIIATLTGVVHKVTDTAVFVRWEDAGNEMEVHLGDIELNGKTLQRVQRALAGQSRFQPRGGTCVGSAYGSGGGVTEIEPESEEYPFLTYAQTVRRSAPPHHLASVPASRRRKARATTRSTLTPPGQCQYRWV
jgi:hypothetical protein